ncbi:hypothetical protein H8A95_28480 [Bradyrhizobium sp. Pear76]|uniref:hypothetical protein n=1 Tax=Bradyrhizobium oropedii TaxID=1571201 RepID=UPI001E328276|nr:hypothetical protein [Bradyrhizobium oropedii]MCC8966154.1 hypothetical protein [Bradyrhizobium oropedii]
MTETLRATKPEFQPTGGSMDTKKASPGARARPFSDGYAYGAKVATGPRARREVGAGITMTEFVNKLTLRASELKTKSANEAARKSKLIDEILFEV